MSDRTIQVPGRDRARRYADACLVTALSLYLAALVCGGSVPRPWWQVSAGTVTAVVSGAALWWRRTHPVPVMLIALVGSAVVQVVAPEGIFPYAGLVALYALAAAAPPRRSLPAAVGLVGVSALNLWTTSREEAAFVMVFSVLVWAVGEATRTRTLAAEEGMRRAAGEQQAALARELHDVIGHSVSVMVVQAAAAADVFDTRPDAARVAVRAIEETGRAALRELRGLLPVVRGGVTPVPSATGLDRLDALLAPLVVAGLDVTIRRETVPGTPVGDALPAPVDAGAYRIIQEALTNALRHAHGSRVDVTVRRSRDWLEVEVQDDGTARGAPAHPAPPGTEESGTEESGTEGSGTEGSGTEGSGRGITGMRERAAELGGSCEAAPVTAGGFRVRARLPLRPEGRRFA